MPLRAYGLLKATIVSRRHATHRSDHYSLTCQAGASRWEVSINAHSDVPPSDVEYAVFRAGNHPLAKRLAALDPGWRTLRPGDGLDYVRGGLCRPEHFKPLPLTKPGANNDLNELFDRHLLLKSTIHAFGEPWGPDPDRGVHDVHQNQGNIRRYADDDGPWQDGGLLVQTGTTWTAILLRFQSQSWRTHDSTGHAH